MPAPRRHATLMEQAIANRLAAGDGVFAAARKAADAVALLGALAVAAHELGHWPTQIEYAAYWKTSDRTTQREWARFKQVFPGEESPERLARHVASELGRRLADKQSVAAAMAVPAPLAVVA